MTSLQSDTQHASSTQPDLFGETRASLRWEIKCGDALTGLRSLPDQSISCVVTSPPYYWLRDYGVPGQIGQENSIADYVDAIACVMDEVFRVLKPTGTVFLNLGDTYYSGKGKSHGHDSKSTKRRFGLRADDKSGGLGIGLQRKSIIGIPWRVAIELMQRKWILRSPIIWHRPSALPEAVIDRPRRSYEYIFMLVKDRRYYFNRASLVEKHIEEDMWTITTKTRSNGSLQTAPFPDELVQRCLDIGCPSDGSVLDPFMGSGTTLRVALNSGRSAVGIDLNPRFCEYAAEMLSAI